jgi:hypothetical protein
MHREGWAFWQLKNDTPTQVSPELAAWVQRRINADDKTCFY